jgi:hypothetical protein
MKLNENNLFLVLLNTTRTTDTPATPTDESSEISGRTLIQVSKDSCTRNECLNIVKSIGVSLEQVIAVIQMRQLWNCSVPLEGTQEGHVENND